MGITSVRLARRTGVPPRTARRLRASLRDACGLEADKPLGSVELIWVLGQRADGRRTPGASDPAPAVKDCPAQRRLLEALAQLILDSAPQVPPRASPWHRRQSFLLALQSGGKRRYRRYLESPLRYAGGKSLAVGLVVERLPDGLERIVSPFIGGGSIEVALARELGLEVRAYDVFDILCCYWQVQLCCPKALARRLRGFRPDRATFAAVKRRLQRHWREGARLDRYALAAHYYFNSNTSYGPHFLGWPSDVYLNPRRYAKMVAKVESFKAPKLSVGCLSFEGAIARHRRDFLYCDPPYYLEEGRTFCGMYPNRNFPIHHRGFRHELLRDLLLKHEAGFMLSYNDCPVIRDWYADCNIEAPSWQYTFGQGDTRIGANRRKLNASSHVKQSHELLIWRHPAGKGAGRRLGRGTQTAPMS